MAVLLTMRLDGGHNFRAFYESKGAYHTLNPARGLIEGFLFFEVAMKKKAIFGGHEPDQSKGELIGSFIEHKIEWGVFRFYRTDDNNEWDNIKVYIMDGSKFRKGNFWISYSDYFDRFSYRGDLLIMMESYPAMLRRLCKILNINYDDVLINFDPFYRRKTN